MRSLAFLVLLAACGTPETSQPVAPEPMAEPTPVEPVAAEQGAAKMNVNSATKAELMRIPGMTDRMVSEFEEYRPYVSISQFRREIGKYVDEATVASYEEHVFVPVHPNDSDAATLAQIDGIDMTTAEELVGKRPFESREAFIEAIREHTDAETHEATAKMIVW